MGAHLPDDVEPSQAELLGIDARYEGADAIITVAGELDRSTAARFLPVSVKRSTRSRDQSLWTATGSRSQTHQASQPCSALVVSPKRLAWLSVSARRRPSFDVSLS